MQTITIQAKATHRSVTTLPNGDIIVWLASKTIIEESKAGWDEYNSVLTGKKVHTSITELSEADRAMCKEFYNLLCV